MGASEICYSQSDSFEHRVPVVGPEPAHPPGTAADKKNHKHTHSLPATNSVPLYMADTSSIGSLKGFRYGKALIHKMLKLCEDKAHCID